MRHAKKTPAARGGRPPEPEARLTRFGTVEAAEAHLLAAFLPSTAAAGFQRTRGATVHIAGAFSQPVKGVDRFLLIVSGAANLNLESANEAPVGVWMKAKPVLEGYLFLPAGDVAELLILVAARRLVGCRVTFEPLRHGHANILSAQLSTTTVSE